MASYLSFKGAALILYEKRDMKVAFFSSRIIVILPNAEPVVKVHSIGILPVDLLKFCPSVYVENKQSVGVKVVVDEGEGLV